MLPESFIVAICCIAGILLIAFFAVSIIARIIKKNREKLFLQLSQNKISIDGKKDGYFLLKDGQLFVVEELPTVTVEKVVEKIVNPEENFVFNDIEDYIKRYKEVVVDDEDSVSFTASNKEKLTFEQELVELPIEVRAMYNKLTEYIMSNGDCKKSRSNKADTFKYKTDKILKAVIKKDTLVLNFMLADANLNRYVREEGVKNIKINPVVIKLESKADLAIAIQTVDISLKNLTQEQVYRKERRNMLRRQKSKDANSVQG